MRKIQKDERDKKDDQVRSTRQDLQKRALDQKDRALDQADKRLDASREDSKRKSARQVISDRESVEIKRTPQKIKREQELKII